MTEGCPPLCCVYLFASLILSSHFCTLLYSSIRSSHIFPYFCFAVCFQEVMEQGDQGYDQKADIWSVGVTALELAFGHPPYSEYAPMKVMLLILKEPPPTPDSYNDNSFRFSKHFHAFVAACLNKDPTKRFVIVVIPMQSMTHPLTLSFLFSSLRLSSSRYLCFSSSLCLFLNPTTSREENEKWRRSSKGNKGRDEQYPTAVTLTKPLILV